MAPRKSHTWKRKSGDFVDDYAWLSDPDDPTVIDYLNSENAYVREWLDQRKETVDRLFAEIKSRVQETDMSVPVRHGDWWYVTRTVEGLEYAIHCRGETADAADSHVVLDENVEAAGKDFFALQTIDVSNDHRLLAWSADLDGSEKATIRFREISTQMDLADTIEGTTWGGSAWSSDNRFFFYVTPDDAMRPWRVWRHEIGTSQDADVCVFEEPDERFYVGLGLTRSERLIVIEAGSKTCSEVWIVPASDPTSTPRVIAQRVDDLEYSIDDWGDQLVVVTNKEALDFKICTASYDSPAVWRELIPHTEGHRITGVEAFSGHLLVSSWRGGQQHISIVSRDGAVRDLDSPSEPHEIELDSNPNFETQTIRFTRQSLTQSPGVFEHDITSGITTTLKLTPVPGADLNNYVSSRVWAPSFDGVNVPVDIVHHVDTKLDGTAPCMVYAYGAYEISTAPWFSVARLSLLDRGFVWALVHPRGGGEMGRRWYFEGRLLNKANTFADVNHAAMHLASTKVADGARMIVRGGSAGGLMVGACINRDRSLWAGAIAEVPFVDVVTTMSDPSMPLTVTEWEEWGDPREEPWASYMLSYSPYDNLIPGSYPAIFATAGLNDPRVSFHEPAKWIAKIRELNTSSKPVLFRCEMGAGHGGPTGRYDRWRDEAEVLTFALDTAGINSQ